MPEIFFEKSPPTTTCMHTQELYYRLALSLVNGIGPVKYKKLISVFGSAEETFRQNFKSLRQTGLLTDGNAAALKSFDDFKLVDRELQYTADHQIHIRCFDDENYPQRLANCVDSPSLLFQKGDVDLNSQRVLSVIGTRAFTEYGRRMCEEMIEQLKGYHAVIVSGMAYGIDIIAHKACVKHSSPTVGVLAHGLHMIYPPAHAPVAKEMLQQGALLSEYFSHSALEKGNFPTRNRIVAGLSDATIVVETDVRGGSMITADIAFSYNREVYCFPGRSIDTKSAGCNLLIRKLKGQLITSADDIARELGWKQMPKPRAVQKELFIMMSEDEKTLLAILRQKQPVHIDELMQLANLNSSQIAAAMLNLEMMNIIHIIPGKMIGLNN